MIPSIIRFHQCGVVVKLEDVCSICDLYSTSLCSLCTVSSCKIYEASIHSSFLAVQYIQTAQVSIHRHMSFMQCVKTTEHVLAFMLEYFYVFKEDIPHTQCKDALVENIVV
jgi:hypothetical protein